MTLPILALLAALALAGVGALLYSLALGLQLRERWLYRTFWR